MRKRQTFQMPNRLILDVSLSYSAKRVGAVLFAHRNALGSCRKSLLELSALSGSIVSTVRSAIDELMGGGYIARKVGYRYSAAHGRVVYDKFTYFCNLDFGGGYTLAPRTLFGRKLHSTAFLLYLYLCYCAGQGGRAFPSLSRIQRDTSMARPTACRAVRELGAARLIYAQACVKADRSFSNNSYFFLCQSVGAAARITTQRPLRPCVRRRLMERVGALMLQRLGTLCPPRGQHCNFTLPRPPKHWKPPFCWG